MTSATRHRHSMIRVWLLAVAGLIFLMVVVGGATRLTESGLSIVEWKPVTGTIPPLDAAGWQAELDKYKTIPQYRQRPGGMTLAEFKTIFWWEWAHRLLGRVIGVAFLLPFLLFLLKGFVGPGLRTRLWLIFGLGALQGAVGWWMVASGLADRTEVSQYRLGVHLTLACLIFAAIVWTAQRLAERPPRPAPASVQAGALVLVAAVLVQIYLGALVAGLRAGLISDTWPLMGGRLIPPSGDLLFLTPTWRNFFENHLTVQFVHRMAAYGLWLLAALHLVDVARRRLGGAALSGALAMVAAVTIQATLGILTILYHVPLGLALGHQAMAMVVLTIAVVHAERLSPANSEWRIANREGAIA